VITSRRAKSKVEELSALAASLFPGKPSSEFVGYNHSPRLRRLSHHLGGVAIDAEAYR
jgi:hypothetical protein